MGMLTTAIGRDNRRSLDETFNGKTGFTWEKKTPDEWSGSFKVNKKRFTVYVKRKSNKANADSWIASFDTDMTPAELVAAGAVVGSAAITVLSTVVSALIQFIELMTPKLLVFSSKVSAKHKDLYGKIAAKLKEKAKELGYKIRSGKKKDFFEVKRDKDGIIREGEDEVFVFGEDDVLDEAFDSVAPDFEWTRKTDMKWNAEFTVDDIYVIIDLARHKMKIAGLSKWELAFDTLVPHEGDRYGKSSEFEPNGLFKNRSIMVMSTVVHAITEFLRDEKPNTLAFTGSKRAGLSDLYTAMARFLRPKVQSLGYDVDHMANGDGDKSFLIYKKAR